MFCITVGLFVTFCTGEIEALTTPPPPTHTHTHNPLPGIPRAFDCASCRERGENLNVAVEGWGIWIYLLF